MQNKKIYSLFSIIVISLFMGYLLSIINDIIWVIIIFMLLTGFIIGFIYNFLLKKLGFNSKDSIFIKMSIILSIFLVGFSINYFDYINTKEKFNISMKGEVENIKKNSIKALKEIHNLNIDIIIKDGIDDYVNSLKGITKIAYQKRYENILSKKSNADLIQLFKSNIKKSNDYNKKEISSLINILDKTDKLIIDNNYIEAVLQLKIFYSNFKKLTGNDNDLVVLNQKLKIIEENLNINGSENIFDNHLESEYGIGGQLGFLAFSQFNGGKIKTKTGNTVDTGIYGGILMYIIDLLVLYGGIISAISVLSILVCNKHNKSFSDFGEDFIFPTTKGDFINIELSEIMTLLNTIPEKKGIFTADTYYVNISFRKCENCELNDTETVIKVNVNHYGTSKIKPIGGIKIYSFIISTEGYNELLKTFNEKILEN